MALELLGRWLEYGLFLAAVVALAYPVSLYVERVFERRPTALDPMLAPLEALSYRIFAVRPDQDMSAGVYFLAFLLFSFVGTLWLLALLLCQAWLPGGPEAGSLTTPMTLDLAGNIALSFSTTATWQAYAGETTLRYLSQMIGLVSQNFLAAAAGLAVGMAFIRGFARENAAGLGNFWSDLVRALLWILLPAGVLGSLFLVWQGVPINLSPYVHARTLEGGSQVIAEGPVAALEFIKNLGTNGGGFFNANGAHPFETPTPLAGFVGLLAITVLPASLAIVFGRMARRPRAGWALLGVMVAFFTVGLLICDQAETITPPRLASARVAGGNMEGKEIRFGEKDSILAAVVTSNGATGSTDSAHDSYQPLSVLTLLVNMLLGEIVFGGLGTGLFSLVMTALIAVFLGGLMIGRTPAYLGKRLGVEETKLVVLYALVPPAVVASLAAFAVTTKSGLAGLATNVGPRGLTEILYAYASSFANNGQTLGGLNSNSLFYNVTTALAMAAGRFLPIALALALSGRMAKQGRLATTSGSLPCDTAAFGALVAAVALIAGALSFLPALTVGPVLEMLRP